MTRGEIWWVDLGVPSGSEPGFRRPVLIIQDDSFNESRIGTVIVAAITSNLNLADAPGNVPLQKKESGLTKDSVVNMSQIVTVDKDRLLERAGKLRSDRMREVESGMRLVLGLE
jgi:mRNA interferase MazF